jgi:predicted RecA/RadA family phage recombinase
MNNFLQSGNSITIPAVAAAVASGQVVKIGNVLAVASHTAAAGQELEAKPRGVFLAPKVSGAVIKQGESLTWDVSANSGAGAFDDNAATPAAGDVTGAAAFAWEDAGAGTTTLAVYFTGVPGTVA